MTPPLVTDSDVRAIYYSTEPSMDPYITTAHLIVDEQLSTSGYSEDRLTQIELWLSAHFAAASNNDELVTQDRAGTSSTSYAANPSVASSTGYGTTRYGRQALALDTKGILQEAGRATARFTVVGCRRSRWSW
jgi:hypothetical protein